MTDESNQNATESEPLYRVNLSFDMDPGFLDNLSELVGLPEARGAECIITIDGQPKNAMFRMHARIARQIREEFASHTICDQCGRAGSNVFPTAPRDGEPSKWLSYVSTWGHVRVSGDQS